MLLFGYFCKQIILGVRVLNMPNPRFPRKFGNCNKPWKQPADRGKSRGSNDTAGTAGVGDEPKKPRPPPGLKGRDLGLWYRDQQRKTNHKEEESNRMTVAVDVDKRYEIEDLLHQASRKGGVIEEGLDKIDQSDFKTSYLKKIEGTFEENLNRVVSQGVEMKRDENFDELAKQRFLKQQEKPKYRDMLTFREKLPSYKKREDILSTLAKNQVIVISGETGCGKTTQVAQFILDDYIMNGNASLCTIVCTQPRRISAVTVAERVAAERAEELGVSIGYQIRLEKVLPNTSTGCITYVTTGILLQWLYTNPGLIGISHLIMDEIHERDTMCDFLLTFLKDILKKRPQLKVILMSATLNAENFSKYYYNYNVPDIHINGFTYPVTEYYLEDVLKMTNFKYKFRTSRFNYRTKFEDFTYKSNIVPYVRNLACDGEYPECVIDQLLEPDSEKLNIDLIECVVQYICRNEPDGAILVFVPGLSQIQDLHKQFTNNSFFAQSRFIITPLHSIMPTTNQREVFKRPPHGVRKIIISTNIAETSITIDDVVYVVDCGRIKLSNFDIKTNVNTLNADWETMANAKQRRGRAGRVQPGKCYRLFTKARMYLFDEYPLPEIQRTRLEEVVLQAKMLQLGRVAPFLARVMDPPEESSVRLALKMLRTLNALDEDEKLTPLGYHLAKLPMDPQTGKMILMGAIFSCVDPIFSIAACLSFKDPFVMPLGKEEEVDKRKMSLSMGEKSDHVVLGQALMQWEEAEQHGDGRDFAWRNYLAPHTLRLLSNMKNQFTAHLYEMKYLNSKNPKDPLSNVNSNNMNLVKAIVCAGLYPNVAKIKKMKGNSVLLRTSEQLRVELHPKSLLSKMNRFDSSYFVYHMMLKSSCVYLHDVTQIYPMSLLFFGEKVEILQEDKNCSIRVDDLVKFNCFKKTGVLVQKLRKQLDCILDGKISNPKLIDWTTDNSEILVLKAIVELITTESEDRDQ